MYRAAMAEGARKKPSEDAEWDEALECWKLCEYWIFTQIIGDDKERNMLAFAFLLMHTTCWSSL